VRKILFTLLSTVFFLQAFSQLSSKDSLLVRQLVSRHAAVLGMNKTDLEESRISSSYETPEGIRLVYLQQTWRGIPVYNQLQVLAFRDGKLVSIAGVRLPDAQLQKVNSGTGNRLSGKDALQKAVVAILPVAKQQQVVLPEPAVDLHGRLDFGKIGIASMPVKGELLWIPQPGGSLRLAWQFLVVPVGGSDSWKIDIDAYTGELAGKYNMTIYEREELAKETTPANSKMAEHFNRPSVQRLAATDQPVDFRKLPVVSSASYRVIKYPAESPLHPGGTPALHSNPWTLSPGNATTYNWHFDGTVYHDSTRGNNVWVAEDRNATDNIIDKAAKSQTAQPALSFNYPPDFTQSPVLTSPANQQFNITNLFYWTNLAHDLSYQYGFTEAAGNFQQSNVGRGGIGGDYLIADAQDGEDFNNANILVPPDGISPHMQMFLFNLTTPFRDGDVDNGIITHEFMHGISVRLTGGPANSDCLNNGEQGGEGWSDYLSLMMTTDWATATPTDGANKRGMGTYVLGQPVNGNGVRQYPYSTNMTINPLAYTRLLPPEVHDLGTIWCTALWEMTWEMIQQTGINRNLFNATGIGGNSAALKLVIEAMKLQPCSPGFIDARNAILKADTIFFNGQYSCAIWRAFSKRGMGRLAKQGSANFVDDQVPDFSNPDYQLSVFPDRSSVQENGQITYTHTLAVNPCAPASTFFVVDTLSPAVTYVSGGTYDAASHSVKMGPFNATGATAQALTYRVAVKPGTYFDPLLLLNETVPDAAMPAGWSAQPTLGWKVLSVPSSGNQFVVGTEIPTTDKILLSPAVTVPASGLANIVRFEFDHQVNMLKGLKGGIVEISNNGGASWIDMKDRFIRGGYNQLMNNPSPLAGRLAYSGATGRTTPLANLSEFSGQSIQLRFHSVNMPTTFGPDGWLLDNIRIKSAPGITVRSVLLNAAGQLLTKADTLIPIVQPCIDSIKNLFGLMSVTACPGDSALFTVSVSGSGIACQWQVNQGSGFTDLAESALFKGTNTRRLRVYPVNAAMNGFAFRCVLQNACSGTVITSEAMLYTGDATGNTTLPVITQQPVNAAGCIGNTIQFRVGVTGTNVAYTWQVWKGSGGFQNLIEGGEYSGVRTPELSVVLASQAMNGYKYRCLISNNCNRVTGSGFAQLTVYPDVSIVPVGDSDFIGACGQNIASFSFGNNVTGAALFQWEERINGIYHDLANTAPYSGVTTPVLRFTNATPQLSFRVYRCRITDYCGRIVYSPERLVIFRPAIELQPVQNKIVCTGRALSISFLTNPDAGASITWTNSNPAIGLPASGAGSIPAFTALNPTTGPLTATITVTASTECFTETISFTITVRHPLSQTMIAPKTYCAGQPVSSIDFGTGTDPGTIVNWTNSNPAIGLPASGTGNLPAFVAANSSDTAIIATIIMSASNGCSGTGQVFTITVKPKVRINAIAARTLCAGIPTGSIPVVVAPVAGVAVSWTNNNPSIGLPASGTGSIPAFVPVNNTATPFTAFIVVQGSNGCSSAGTGFSITVLPKIVLSQVANKTVCTGTPVAAVSSGIPATSGATVTWFNNNPAIGLAASGTGDVPSFTAVNNSNAPITATIAINASNACSGTGIIYTITVLPKPVINVVSNKTLCAGTTVPAITSGVPASTGATVSWTNSNTSIGLAASGTGDIPAFVATNTSNTAQTASISFNAGNSCGGSGSLFTITVLPRPVVNPVTSQTRCAGQYTAAINFTGNLPAGSVVYRWTNTNTSIGLAASGTGSIPSFLALNNTCYVTTATITVTPYTTAGNCAGTPVTFTITVQPSLALSAIATPGFAAKTGTDLAPSGLPLPASWRATVYPNPAATVFAVQVTGNRPEPIYITIRNGDGKLIKTERREANSKQQLYAGKGLPAGIYLIEVVQGPEKQVLKLIKTN